jgi:colicin import membrane protein
MQRPSDRWISIALSVLLHGALLAALVWGWMLYRQPPPPAPTLAIEARVVDARAVRGAPTPEPAPPAAAPPAEQPPPPPEPEGPPQPTPEELAAREKQRQDAAAVEQAQQQAQEKAAEEAAAKASAAKAAAKLAEEQRKARELAAQKKAEEQEQAREDSEVQADLKRSLAQEQSNAARAGPALANWQAQIAAAITRAWRRPPTARPGIQCMLNVTQVPGGQVTAVSIGDCNGDQAVRESIEAAVYRASPLPPPPDPSLFDRNLRINFRPD